MNSLSTVACNSNPHRLTTTHRYICFPYKFRSSRLKTAMFSCHASVKITQCDGSSCGVDDHAAAQSPRKLTNSMRKFYEQGVKGLDVCTESPPAPAINKRKRRFVAGSDSDDSGRPRKRARSSTTSSTGQTDEIESDIATPASNLVLAAVTFHIDEPGQIQHHDPACVLPVSLDDNIYLQLGTEGSSRRSAGRRRMTPAHATEHVELDFDFSISIPRSTADAPCSSELRIYGSHVETHVDAYEVLKDVQVCLKRSRKGRSNRVGTQCTLLPPSTTRRTWDLVISLTWELQRPGIEDERTDDILWGLSCLKKYTCIDGVDAASGSAAANVSGSLTWKPEDFYNYVHTTSPDDEVSSKIQTKMLESELYPFQRRAVNWLLRREGVGFSNGELVPLQPQYSRDNLPPSFTKMRAKHGVDTRDVYVSKEMAMVTLDPAACRIPQEVKGGILAEEMGLGKTVELVALIALHKRAQSGKQWDAYSMTEVTRSGATLIVTPSSLIQQWKSEINRHAPSLRVHEFKGTTTASHAPKARYAAASTETLLKFDIVLTTYAVLRREVHFARPPPDRSTRHGTAKEARRRSPLVEIHWWRVCLDEAQMVENGVSKAAEVARLIPRVNAWAVSGTPLRKNVQDLRGLLAFLRYEPYCRHEKLFSGMERRVFRELFGRIALRHTKAGVRHELSLPPQKRVVITVPFTPVEEQNYANLFAEMCGAIQMTPEGNPAVDDWDPKDYTEQMRRYLIRLRQTCLHPQVGGRNRKALGRRNVPLRTVADVLEVMIGQNETSIRNAECDFIAETLTRGHIYAHAKDIPHRAKKALEIYDNALQLANEFVEDCRRELVEEMAKAKAKAKAGSEDKEHEEDSQDEEGKDEEQAEKDDRVRAGRNILRRALEAQHACLFYTGTAYYQMKSNADIVEPESEEFQRLEKLETEFYDRAKVVRKELLQENRTRAEKSMAILNRKVKNQGLAPLQPLQDIDDVGGIENRKTLERIDQLIDTLNEQGELLSKWRAKAVDILQLPLVDTDETETTGDEYENSTKQQDDLVIYMTALRAIQADRHFTLTGQENFRVDDEIRTAIRQARNGEGHAPQLMLQLMERRNALKSKPMDPNLRGVLCELRHLETSIQWQVEMGRPRAAMELSIIQQQMKRLQGIQSTETKTLSSLELEHNQYHQTMNRRIAFYAQLQQISDTVAPYKEEMDERLDRQALGEHEKKEEKITKQLASLRTRRRFLHHLKHESNTEDGPRSCAICTGLIEIGSLTSCGHVFCKECLRMWYRSHRSCPQCRKHLTIEDFQDITYRPQELQAIQEDMGQLEQASSSASGTPMSNLSSLYSDMSGTTMQEIKGVELNGSYGTKIDTMSRHVLWLRQNDPGSKCIIFSQYSDFLGVLAEAFTKFKIGHTSITARDGIEKFKNSASVECFLLDAKSNASGLNLTNATHVFLAEPMINSALELQAIARVHRIGQQRETAVYMYLVSDTVEEAIYDISVNRRIKHMGSQSSTVTSRVVSRAATPGAAAQEKAMDDANNREIERAPLSMLLDKKKGRGEFVDEGDLWNCLFSQAQRRPVSPDLQRTVDRHLRAEAAQQRLLQGSDESDGINP
ncbi:hypothetical protein EJ05DRAFT_55747 [Pseudovirgaria hyperparasitica]|uniref:ATP-dependent DNA helicase n=1 Tax=Pseudovirgaria hyperparasitica TaxID=470096 RepID=A0A6A6W565_9PEZI|nr:uncharacterized protein EJ05DRAFT_55747 [Pseudovirgaria hyperparasitica]KAF2757096.1 hypothetical protein EJ05DRAFT_55747 [Pseudovirgaria hyperparasitica]